MPPGVGDKRSCTRTQLPLICPGRSRTNAGSARETSCVVAAVVMLVVLLLTGVFIGVLIVGLRGSVRDASTQDKRSVLRHAWVVLAALEVLGVALAVTAAILIAHQLGLPDDSGGFVLTWFLCCAVGLAPLVVMAAIYGQRYRRAATSGSADSRRLPSGPPHSQ